MKLTFDDVLIEPQFSKIKSRSEVDLTTNLGNNLELSIPIISANMDTVTDVEMSSALYRLGAMGCMHRFMGIAENRSKYISVLQHNADNCIVSFGLGENEQGRVQELADVGAEYFCLDVAHGAQQQVVDQVLWFKENYPNLWLMVGNFASRDSVRDFLHHCSEFYKPEKYPDAIKVGVGPGSACTTRIKTGVGFPQITAIQEINQILGCRPFKTKEIKIIADGGLRTSGDIAKALAAGADAVMLGGMIAGTDETPPAVKYLEQIGKKIPHIRFPDKLNYRGSASSQSYKDQGKAWSTAEGESFMVDYKGPVKRIITDIEGGLKSAFTYVGARNMEEFQSRAKLIHVSPNTQSLNIAHGRK